ncbi:MAG: LptF/LptG family permease [Candidatus Neomarinimicrobiota bacterium]
MRLLTRYMVKELFLPFIFSLLVIIFVLFIQFLLRAIDRFLGKGLDVVTILEYLFLNLAWIIALAVPMAVLIATLMSFGRLSEDNEITAMRTSGISFLTIIRPALMFGLIICLGLIYFNNFILPEMNFHARMLSGDIYRKRPDMQIDPGHFIGEIPDYGMIVGGKDGDIMSDVRIFSKTTGNTQTSIYSKTGTLTTISDALVLTLFDGEIHELDIEDFNDYRRIEFTKHVITMPVENLELTRRDTSNRSDREMTVPMMMEKRSNYQARIITVNQRMKNTFRLATGDSTVPVSYESAMDQIHEHRLALEQDTLLNSSQVRVKERRLRNLERQAANEFNLIRSYLKNQNRYGVEIHKKFSLPVACILFVLLGAPLGVLAKKGGFVIGTSLSFGFFLIYYLMLIGGEEMADRSVVSPTVGMWTPNVMLLLIASYLTLNTVRERAPFNINWPAFLNRHKKPKETA